VGKASPSEMLFVHWVDRLSATINWAQFPNLNDLVRRETGDKFIFVFGGALVLDQHNQQKALRCLKKC